MKDNKIAIFTTFYEIDEAYSLCNVVEDQLKMLINNDYKIKLIVDEGINRDTMTGIWNHPNITLCKTPPVSRSNDGILPDNYQEETNRFYESLKGHLEGVRICIAHDVTLQPAHLIHNIAARRIADERDDLFWLHWSHSSTAPSVRCSDESARQIIQKKFPHSYMCYPNDWDRKRVAINHGYEMDEVKCVHHPSDFLSMMFGDELDFGQMPEVSDEAKAYLSKHINYPIQLSKDLVNEYDILSADVISVYPCRLDRGKQPEWNIKTMAKIKEMGRSVRMIMFDFHSTGGDKVTFRDECKRVGKEWGLTDKELIWISEWREDTNLHAPRAMVMNLKKLADFHMHPSTSETYSLVIQESMAWRNFVIANHHTPYMRDIWGSKNVDYEPMSSAVNMLDGEDGSTTLNINDEQKHFENLAKKVIYFIEVANPVINQWRFIRQKRSLDYIFKNELEPLFYRKDLKPLK